MFKNLYDLENLPCDVPNVCNPVHDHNRIRHREDGRENEAPRTLDENLVVHEAYVVEHVAAVPDVQQSARGRVPRGEDGPEDCANLVADTVKHQVASVGRQGDARLQLKLLILEVQGSHVVNGDVVEDLETVAK